VKRLVLVLPLILIVALAIMGVGYGLWYENLAIDGSISTGTVSAEFLETLPSGMAAYSCNDNEVPATANAWKDIGSVSMEIDPNDPTIAIVTINNAYPLYGTDCSFKYKVTGSVPVHVEYFEFLPNYPAGGTAQLTNCHPVMGTNGTSLATECDQLDATLADGGICSQWHTGDIVPHNMYLTIKQPAEQGKQYKFAFRVRLNQYNESSCP